MSRFTRSVAFVVAFVSIAAASGAQEPTLEDILRRAAAYVAEFQKQLSGIVAEEIYEQQAKQSGAVFTNRRRLKSDLLLVRPVGADRYVEFRDVFEVDGEAVRDRSERLSKLFLNPPPGALSQLERVVTESARYNIGRVVRTLNTPVLPLAFLSDRYQWQFEFTLTRDRATDGTVIGFTEKERPTLVRTPAGLDMPSRGRFWIDPITGAVMKSELIIQDVTIKATVNVTYRSDADLGFLVPQEMREEYVSVAQRDRIEGRATYGRFRKFQVRVDEAIKPVKQ